MATIQRLKLRDGDRLIDADFTIDVTGPTTFELILESGGGATGGRTARNSEYALGLEELIRRSERIASTLDDCLVGSRVARSLPEEQRRVAPTQPYAYPITLTPTEDFARLRLALTSPQVNIASKARSGGNMRKKILLRFTARNPNVTLGEIQSALHAAPTDTPKRDRKDIAVGLTNAAIDAARREWREIGAENFHRKYGTSRANKFIIVDPDGTESDAKAILFGARTITGLDGSSSDFDGDRQTVQEPLQALGYVVEDITKEDEDNPPTPTQMTEVERKRAVQLAKNFAGNTDSIVERMVRREQRLLRKSLGLHEGSHACSLCGRIYPDRLLVAAHIKKRSECTKAEKIDIPEVAMIACILGCDALFEHGYVTVTDDGIVQATMKSESEEHLRQMVQALHGRTVTNFNPDSVSYFTWHRNNCDG